MAFMESTPIDPTGANELMFDMNAPNYSQNARMLLPIAKLDPFLGSLSSAKEYYLKWCVIAKKNQSVAHFSKDFPVKFIDQTMLFTSEGKWHRENGVNLTARFYVDNTGKCYLVLDTDYMTSEEVVEHGVSSWGVGGRMLGLGRTSSETTVTHYCAGASLFFSSEQEIDSFIAMMKAVKKWKEGNVAVGKLFK